MSLSEILGFITGAACVVLAVKENVWNWPIGIINNVFFLLLFWHSRLYADALLQVVYVAIGLYGWWNWVRGGAHHGKLVISRVSRANLGLMLLVVGIFTFVIRCLLVRFTDSSVPTLDAVTTALSLIAQYMLGMKWIENWYFWMIADVIYIGLYQFKGLSLTAILYGLFFVMCIAGWREWSKTLVTPSTSGGTK
jgi:nicotinamide mononucleotide transporter